MGKPFNTLKAYGRDIRGQFAVQFAILALPLVAFTTFVIDQRAADVERVNIKTALDAAVIATVNNNSLTDTQKEDYALEHFNTNYSGNIQLELDPRVVDSRIEMTASGMAPVTVADAVGLEGIPVTEKSVAELTSENVICVLSLAPSGDSRISFSGKVKFNAPSCSVHANSTDSQAIWATKGLTPAAKNFCSAGGAWGTYQPYAKGNCAPVEDPYRYHTAPPVGPCINLGSISDLGTIAPDESGSGGPKGPKGAVANTNGGGNGGGNAAENLTGSNVSLAPGTYCGGLTVDGTNVTFLPGNHIMLDGPLVFRNSAEAFANDVTFVMKGKTATLNIQSGSEVDVKAPGEGALAGLAFFQDVNHNSASPATFPNGFNTLSSGGELNVTGTVYFPTQTIEVNGQAVFGSNAPATSFIAYNADFYGSPIINVSVDHQRAGLPPVLPRSEDGARLVE